jgi:hypothetical protein
VDRRRHSRALCPRRISRLYGLRPIRTEPGQQRRSIGNGPIESGAKEWAKAQD